ncbi:fibronectin type III domain-containing protein [Puniceicoccaceae bacterium K14]|nr:fibronectin type III domain-containing protein [Puniceicoccaceae bacterium K14]
MNYLKTITTSLVTAAVLCAAGNASISVSVDLESLKAANGNALPNSGVAVLVVSPDNSDFSAPASGAIIPDSSDDQILAMWDLSDPNVSSDAYSLLEQSIEYKSSEGWSSGDPLGLYWFPDLDISDPTPGANETYGFYRDSSGELSGDAWELPEDGTLLHSLKLFTAGSDDLVNAGELPDLIGYALLTIGDSISPVSSPSGLDSVEENAGEILLSWASAVSTPFGALQIERREVGSDSWEAIGTASDGSTSFTDDTIGRGKEYEYRLFAVNGLSSEFSSVLAADLTLRSNLVNVATRGLLGNGKEVMIAGFVTEGAGNIDVLAQTVGPNFEGEVVGYVTDPSAFIYLGAEDLIADNDNWSTEGVTEISDAQVRLGATSFAADSLDSSLLLPLVSNNAYTMIALDNTGVGGVALVEVYHDHVGDAIDADTRLVNISTRGKVGTVNDIMIGGFVIDGEVNMTVLLRGSGPGLVYNDPASFDSSEILSDPTLILYKLVDGAFQEVATNNDWESDDAAQLSEAFDKTGAFQLESGSKDAALIADLEPGQYTVFLLGTSAETGIGLFEVYEIAD